MARGVSGETEPPECTSVRLAPGGRGVDTARGEMEMA